MQVRVISKDVLWYFWSSQVYGQDRFFGVDLKLKEFENKILWASQKWQTTKPGYMVSFFYEDFKWYPEFLNKWIVFDELDIA